MSDLLRPSALQAMLSVVGLLIVMYTAFRVIERLRPSTSKDDMSDDNSVGDFEEMQLEGDINAEELRSIRAVLGKTQDERRSGSE